MENETQPQEQHSIKSVEKQATKEETTIQSTAQLGKPFNMFRAITITVVLLVALIIGVFIFSSKDIEEEEIIDTASYFRDSVIQLVIEDLGGYPQVGFDEEIIRRTFPGIWWDDFTNVDTVKGRYSAAVLGYEELLENISNRLEIPISGKKSVDLLITEISKVPDPHFVEAKLDQEFDVLGVDIYPFQVLEDSRCPIDLVCVQEGTVRLRVGFIISGLGEGDADFVLNQPVIGDTDNVTLVEVKPDPVSSKTIEPSDYVFRFKVEKHLPLTKPVIVSADCYVGGCHNRACTDRPDLSEPSDLDGCNGREEEYACYETAICERQTTGECDWTHTPELKSCFDKALYF